MLTFRARRGFTLVELMVAIAIIAMLAGLALGGMWRADLAAKEANSKITVAKVSAQVKEIWESYRSRRLPVEPQDVLGQTPAQAWPAATGWLQYYLSYRSADIPAAHDPLNAPYSTFASGQQAGKPIPYGNHIQQAAIKLAATHELMRLEMPCRFLDFTDNPAAINGGGSLPAVTALLIQQPRNASGQPIANPGGLSEQYRQFFVAHYDWQNVPYDPKTSTYEAAECLYMIIKFASQNELGQKSIIDDPRLVGDVDGDGMPEIQDYFTPGDYTPPRAGSPFTQHRKPISFVRWPAGFVLDLQPGANAPSTQHEIFDPLRIDPRAFQLTPLVYSGGLDAQYGIWELGDYSQFSASQQPFFKNDPYFTNSPNFPAPGSPMAVGTTWPGGLVGDGSYADNITNHAALR